MNGGDEEWFPSAGPKHDVPASAKTLRDALQALEGAAPVSCTGPDGETLVLLFTSVSDLRLAKDEDGKIRYVIDMVAEQRTTPS